MSCPPGRVEKCEVRVKPLQTESFARSLIVTSCPEGLPGCVNGMVVARSVQCQDATSPPKRLGCANHMGEADDVFPRIATSRHEEAPISVSVTAVVNDVTPSTVPSQHEETPTTAIGTGEPRYALMKVVTTWPSPRVTTASSTEGDIAVKYPNARRRPFDLQSSAGCMGAGYHVPSHNASTCHTGRRDCADDMLEVGGAHSPCAPSLLRHRHATASNTGEERGAHSPCAPSLHSHPLIAAYNTEEERGA